MLIELNYPDPTPVTLEAGKTMLLIVDMENEAANPAGALYYEPAARLIPRIAELRRRVREAGGRVVHTQSIRSPDALEFTVFNNKRRHLGAWDVDFVEELKPEPDEPVVIKQTHDSFFETDMESVLERLGVRRGDGRVIVTGIGARSCFQCAALGFSIRDYHVYLPIDCTAAREEKEVLQTFSLFTTHSYRYNVTMTRSDLISLNPARVRLAGESARADGR